jgi:hypothetical protein
MQLVFANEIKYTRKKEEREAPTGPEFIADNKQLQRDGEYKCGILSNCSNAEDCTNSNGACEHEKS